MFIYQQDCSRFVIKAKVIYKPKKVKGDDLSHPFLTLMFCGHICPATEWLLMLLHFLASYEYPWPSSPIQQWKTEKLGDASHLPLTKQLLPSRLLIRENKVSFTVTVTFCIHVCYIWICMDLWADMFGCLSWLFSIIYIEQEGVSHWTWNLSFHLVG